MIVHTRAAWMLGALATVRVGLVHAAEPAPRHAAVEVDTSDVGEEGPVIKRRAQERTDVVLRAADVRPGRSDADDPVIHVDIDELTGPDPGYVCEVWLSHGDAVLGERRRVECPLCTESEIVQRVETAVAELVAQLPAPTAAAEPPAEPTPAPASTSTPASTEPEQTPSDPPRARLRRLGKAGVGLVVAGAAGVGVGAVLVARPPVVDRTDPLYETTTRPPGVATLVAGAAVLVGGVALLVLDRRRARARTTALAPRLGRDHVGVTWSARF